MSFFKVNNKFNIGNLIISILITLGGGLIIGFIINNADKQYVNLNKPMFAPPSWVFPIVWSVLYILIGIAAYRIYELKKQGKNTKNALVYYSIQLILNFLWPIIFFKLRLYGVAFIELIVLIIFILITTIKFFKVDRVAGFLMLPYILWSLYASILNLFVWIMNEM
ncbi:TspO/MBR family protein [Clostridium folliculivorans]|uniref:Tryptophan-rich sensory protein n=1 Tax=Clostridium folliculivorans TaxID=2886038 RepID=A0A9W6DB98_9CLOT|nr:TspO/MBR family protein [Clostridium folliculivorans]GKU25488.1 tryptophan-rich sensory protein [Clostridium folliculivorans]GKU28511.1 tryptophan-rich sensory protein [Clostridium folliculivorans]